MTRTLRIALLLWAPVAALAADGASIARLEQEVRTLRRDLQQLSRQVDELRMQSSRPQGARNAPAPVPAALPLWLDADKWRRIRAGMAELEVIATLGSPTSTREEDGAQVLLYAMQIGPTAFVSGSVLLRDHAVTEVRIPALR